MLSKCGGSQRNLVDKVTTAISLALGTLGSIPRAVHKELILMEDAMAFQEQLVTRAASKVSIFHQLSMESRDPLQSANDWNNRSSLQKSAGVAIGAVNDAMRCDPGLSKTCKTLEDPAREFRMAPGTAVEAIKALKPYR